MKEKLIQHNYIVIQADKGQTLVILPLNQFNNKVEKFVDKNNIELLNHDLIDNFQSKQTQTNQTTFYHINTGLK